MFLALVLQDLPHLNAALNAAAFVVVGTGFIAVKKKKVTLHKVLMLLGLLISICFMTSYLIYHLHPDTTAKKFEGAAYLRYPYLVMLVTHIILAIVTVPLVLTSAWLGIRGRITKHRKLVRWTLPIWIYVSITGVLIYLSLY